MSPHTSFIPPLTLKPPPRQYHRYVNRHRICASSNASSSDVLIIGGGVIGLSTAIELARSGASVSVICRDANESATRNAAGMMAASCEQLEGPLAQLASTSLQLYPRFVDTLPGDVRYTARDDFLIPLLDDEKGQSIYNRETINAIEPSLGPRVVGARPAIGDAHIDNRSLLRALQHACVLEGVQLRNDNVQRLQISGSVVSHAVLESGAIINANRFVAAAGAWTQRLLPFIPVRPVKGQMISLRPRNNRNPLPIHVLYGRDAYIVPKSNNIYFVGATVEDVGFDRVPTAGAVANLLHAATTLVPAFADCAIEEIWAGLRPTTPDLLPVIGNTPYHNLTVATGTFRNGVLFAPAIAKLTAACVLDESDSLQPELHQLLLPFSAARFTKSSSAFNPMTSNNRENNFSNFSSADASSKPQINIPSPTLLSKSESQPPVLLWRVKPDGAKEPIKPSLEHLEMIRKRSDVQDNEVTKIPLPSVHQPESKSTLSSSETNLPSDLEEPNWQQLANGKWIPASSTPTPSENGVVQTTKSANSYTADSDAYEDVMKYRANAEEMLRKGMAANRGFGRTKSSLEEEGETLMMSREDEIAFDAAFAAADEEIARMDPGTFSVDLSPVTSSSTSQIPPNESKLSTSSTANPESKQLTPPSNSDDEPKWQKQANGKWCLATTQSTAELESPPANASNQPVLLERVLPDGTREPIQPSAQFIQLTRRRMNATSASSENNDTQNTESEDSYTADSDAYEDVMKYRANAEEMLRKGMAANRGFGRTKSSLEEEGETLMMSREDEIAFDAAFAAADEEIARMDPDTFHVS